MFKVGDEVRIRKTSRFHNRDRLNPHNNIVGVIIRMEEGSFPVWVNWQSEGTNCYDEIDLEFAGDDFEGNV